jgi:hypothetical protein
MKETRKRTDDDGASKWPGIRITNKKYRSIQPICKDAGEINLNWNAFTTSK